MKWAKIGQVKIVDLRRLDKEFGKKKV